MVKFCTWLVFDLCRELADVLQGLHFFHGRATWDRRVPCAVVLASGIQAHFFGHLCYVGPGESEILLDSSRPLL